MQGRFLISVNGPIVGWEIWIFKQLSSIAAQPFDMLIVGLLEPTLQTSVHCPVSEKSTKCPFVKKEKSFLLLNAVCTWTRWTACRPFCSGFASHGATASLGHPLQQKIKISILVGPQKYFVTSQSECNIFPIFGTSPLFIDLLSKMSCQMSRIHQYSGHCCFADSQGNAKDLYSYLSSNTSQFLA